MAEKILIVDDDHDTIEFLKIVLTRQGYQTIIAGDGIEALQVANQEMPDLIILDVMMPNLDGYEVARTLHRYPQTAMIPILMFTARAQMEDKVVGYDAGVDLYLTKPVHPLDLQANIKNLLLQRKARKAALAERGFVVGVVSAKGGVGVSTVALNLAATYAHQHKVSTIAAEMRPGQGTWSDELNLSGGNGLARLLRLNTPEITQSQVENCLASSTFGVRLLLSGSGFGTDNDLITAINQYEAIVQNLAAMAGLVVLDMGPCCLPAFSALLDQCDELVVVTEPQPLCVRRTVRVFEELRSRGFGTAKFLTLVTLNHTRSEITMSLAQIESALRQPVALGFSPVIELAGRAMLTATPLCLVQPESNIALEFSKLAGIVNKHIK